MNTQSTLVLASLLVLSTSMTAESGSAQCMSDRLSSSNGSGGDIFGRSLAVSGGTLLVGASRTDRDGFLSTGSVYRFERTPSGFVEVEEWNAFDAAEQDEFGEHVAIDGDWAVVGARWGDDGGSNAGAVYLWQRVGTNWVAGPKLVGSQADASGLFGAAVGVADGPTPRIAVGAYWHGDAGTGAITGGAVYIFEYDAGNSQWNEVQIVRSDDIALGDFFGQALAFDGQRLVVGAPSANAAGTLSGAVYVFDHDGVQFVQTQKLLGSDVGVSDFFGKKVALGGDRLAVTGRRAYVFDHIAGSWTQDAILVGSGVSGSWGDSIALSGDRLVVTEHYFGSGGGAWFFDRSGGSWLETGTTTQETAGDYYGRNSVVDGDQALVSADSANVGGNGTTAGEVYAYPLSSPDCNGNGVADACDLFNGTSLDANANGVPDECDGGPQNYCSSTPNSTGGAAVTTIVGSTSLATNEFTVSASPVPNQPCLFFYGANQTDTAFGNGRLCVGAPQFRLPIIAASGNTASYTYDLTLPLGGAPPIASGSVWNFQLWFRDPGVGANFDLSDAVSVQFTP